MVKKTKGKHRLDKFYHLAKEQGYRSRAAFKLIQLNRKYDFLSSARTVLDLCAAPGGWCQVAVKTMPVGSLIIGVDLIPIKPIRGVKTLIGDITTQQCRQAILKETGGSLMDVVLHDGAPNVGGAWSSEAYAQSWLVLESLRMATDVLAPQGTFVTKIFRSKDYTALLYAFNQLFTKVEATKPAASRNASAEIFVVCRGYKAPSRIDPRLLDAKFLFKEVADAPKIGGPDALLKAKVKQKRFREGYEDGMTIARKVIAALAFVMAPNPIELLGQVTSIAIDGPDSKELPEGESETIPDLSYAAEFLRSHPATSEEIRILLQDLQVIGRSEFKALLKWRLSVRKDLMKYLESQREDEKQSSRETSEDEGKEASDVIEVKTMEDRLLEEMEAIKSRLQRREKRDRKRRRELKLKSRLRAIQLAQLEGIADGEADPNGPDGLFSLAQIRSKKQASNVADADVPTESESEQERPDLSSDDSVDSDEERNEEDARLDQYLEESYKAWKIRQRMRESGGGVVKKRRKRLGADGELEDDFDDVDTFAFENDKSISEEEEEEEDSDNGLLVSLDNRKENKLNPDAATEQWFAQDLFNEEDLEEDEENFNRIENQRPPEIVVKSNSSVDVSEIGDDENENEKNEAKQEEEKEAIRRAFAGNEKSSANGFEVVPLSESDGGDSDEEEFEALNDDAKAEILALAKRFIRRKDKENLMEAAYNRYAFHDTNLPKWFMEDESKFMRPAPQLSAAEIAEAKERLRAIDARPIKKVVEAKARKRKRLAAKLTQARQKAESIAGQEDMPMAAKMREIEKLYAKARAGGGSKKGKNGKKSSRRDGKKRKGPPLDPRLRSDKRGMDAAAKRMKNKVSKKGRR